jgi:2-polyprenyl-6-methoxyphenol hydroxylase-like FAD-dependent oxidoreductase
MCPFKGQGANQALRDGATLGRLFATAIRLPEAVAEFRAEMHARALKQVRQSRAKIAMLHSDDEFSRQFFQLSRAQADFIRHLRERGVGFQQVGEIEEVILRELSRYNTLENVS